MNYNSLLDSWFGNPWLSYGVPLGIFVLMIVYLFRQRKRKKEVFAINIKDGKLAWRQNYNSIFLILR